MFFEACGNLPFKKSMAHQATRISHLTFFFVGMNWANWENGANEAGLRTSEVLCLSRVSHVSVEWKKSRRKYNLHRNT